MEKFRHFLEDHNVGAMIQAIGGGYLVGGTWVALVYHTYLGVMSFIAITCGGVLSLHGVCRLVLPICRKWPRYPGVPPAPSADE